MDQSQDALGIVAGGGELPRIVADAALADGRGAVVVVQIADAIDEDWSTYDSRPFAWGRVGDAIAYMKTRGVKRLVFCGTVTKRPDFRSLMPSLKTLRIMPSVLNIVRGGDDRLLRSLTRFLETSHGFTLVGVQDIVPRLLTPLGALTRRPPNGAESAALVLGAKAALRLGELDIGQAVVASNDRVIALEGIEGTKVMLERVADLRRAGRIGKSERCVLVKMKKPVQDERFDLPSIGVSTIEEAATAGITAIGVSAGHSLILGLDEVVAAASRHGIALVGLASQVEAPGGTSGAQCAERAEGKPS